MKGDAGGADGGREGGREGEKGDAADSDPISVANWKQCVWKSMNNGFIHLRVCSMGREMEGSKLNI